MKTLYLLRHAKAQGAQLGMDDSARPLNARGEGDAQALGAYLSRHKPAVDLILCSPSARTRQTLALVQKSWKHKARIEFSEVIYLASPKELLEVLRGLPEAVESVMLVGHNPGMHELACALVDDAPEELREGFPTCTLAKIGFEAAAWDEVAPGMGTLAALLQPAMLKACA